ncbi:MAG: hypothetical protein WD709_00975, partial [Gammaproteobacteria bacterium]
QTQDVIMGVGLFGLGAPSPGRVLTDSMFVAVSPDDTEPPEQVGITLGYEASIFLDADDNLIGTLFTEDEDGFPFRVAATVDLDAMLKGDDPASVFEAQALLTLADPGVVNDFLASTPASVTDSVLNGDGFGWGRWTDGAILVYDDSEATELVQLNDDQSIHFIYGPDPGMLPTFGMAYYEFAGGTRSTSAGGGSIGVGVVSGDISVYFGDGFGSINMQVNHIAGFPYDINGSLLFMPSKNHIFDDGVMATTLDGSSLCFSGCPVFIDGAFAVPGEGINAPPGFIGIEYDIQDTDVVTGVAGFELDTGT